MSGEDVPLSVRLPALWRRVPTWLVDALIATAFLALSLAVLGGTETDEIEGLSGPDAAAVLLTIACVLPYYVRRRWPFPAFLVSLAFLIPLVIGDWTIDVPAFLTLVGTYTVGAYCNGRERLIAMAALAFVFLVIIVTELPGADAGGILVNVGFYVAAYFFGATMRNRRLYVEQLEEQARTLERERDEEAKRAVADERLRIAQELHDVVAHSMGVIAVQAGVGAHVIDNDPAEAKKSLEAISSTSRTTLTEIRRILGVLRDDTGAEYQPSPGLEELPKLVHDVRAAGVDVDVKVEGARCELPPGLDLTAYRIVQEALTNVLKHAGPAHASVVVDYAPGALRLEVSDDGRGVNGRAENGGGHGLLGMRERVAVYGGTLAAGPKVGGGFRVSAELPYAEPE
jgi:signal transduction histidine kinase